MVRSAPAQNVSLPEVMTAPLIAASAATCSTMRVKLLHHLEVDDVHRAAGHVPGDERDAVGVGVELEMDDGHGSVSLLAGYGSPDCAEAHAGWRRVP